MADSKDLQNQETATVKAPADALRDTQNQEMGTADSAVSVAKKVAERIAAKRAKKGAAMADGGPAPDAAPTAEGEPASGVNVVDPEGNLVSLPHEQVADAIQNQGYQPATQAHVDAYVRNQAYGGAGQGALAGLEGAASAATFGASTALERGFTSPEDIAGRAEEHPIAHGVGEAAGLIGSSLLGTGEGAVLEHAGQAASDAAGLGTLTTGAKVGSAAVKAAAENALFQGGDEVSKYFSDQTDPNTPVQTAVVNMLGAGLVGGALGAAGSAISPLWKATVGDKLGGTLGAIASRLGGQEGGATDDVVTKALSQLGIEGTPPEALSILSNDPAIKNMANNLVQSPSAAGEKFQETAKNLRQSVLDSISRTMGKEPSELSGEFSNAEAGTHIGQTLSNEYAEKMEPISDAFESNKAKYGSAELSPSMAEKAPDLADTQNKLTMQLDKTNRLLQKSLKANDVEGAIAHNATIGDVQGQLNQLNQSAKVPGTVDDIAHKLGTLANEGKWGLNEDISKQLQKVMGQLPEMKTVSDLQGEMSRLGSVARDLRVKTFGQATEESRAVEMMRGVLRNSEENAVAHSIGSEEGQEALDKFNKARKDFAGVAGLKEDLDARLGVKGSATNYAKGIASMAKEQPEKIFSKLSGKGDSALLDTLTQHFPETAQAVREAHTQDILAKAVRAGRNGESLNPTTLRKSLTEMAGKSPELKNFLFDKATQGKLDAASQMLERMNDPHYNFSNTARVHTKLNENMPGSALGMISMLTGHGLAESVGVGSLTKLLGREAPDALRLATLKFLGSNKPIEPGAFKATVDFIRSTIKGENAVNGAVKSLFKAGREVIPSSMMSDQRDNDKLEKHLDTAQQNPSAMLNTANAGAGLGHYMPNHAAAQAQTAATVSTYLNSIKPQNVQKSPLDTKQPMTPTQKAGWQNALTIANQPLTVMQKIKDGTLTSTDIKHANSMYPQLMQSLRTKMVAEITNATTDEDAIPYKRRVMMSLFMGQPLDSTMQPASIMAAQPAPQEPSPPPPGKNKKSTASLGKNNSLYKTPSQAADQDRQRDT